MKTRRSRTVRAWSVGLALLLASACGTTVRGGETFQSVGAGGAAQPVGPGGSQGAGSSAGMTGPVQGGTGAGLSAGAGQRSASNPGTPQAASSGRVPSSSITTLSPAGVASGGGPAATLQLGMVRLINNNSFVSSLNGKGLTVGDVVVEQNAVISYINAHGGIDGRRVVPVYADYDVSNTSSFDSQIQSMCSTWTQDNHVFAVLLGWAVESPTLEQCLASRNTPWIYNSVPSRCESCLDGQVYQRYPLLLAPTSFELGSMSRSYVDGLAAQGFFAKGTKVGILLWDQAAVQRVMAGVVLPRLNQMGIQSDVETIHWPGSNTEIDQTGTAISSAELRFRTDGVSEVMFWDTGGYGALADLFMQAAEAQKYRPRYGLMSGSRPVTLVQNVAVAQLENAVGVGWDPGADVDDQHDAAATTQTTVCRSIMTAAGQQFADRNAEYTAIGICDGLFFLQQVLAHAPSLTASALVAQAEALGGSFVPATQISTQFSSSRHAGVSGYRHLRFDAGCTCFVYVGGVVPSS